MKDALIAYDGARGSDFFHLSGNTSTTVSVNADGAGADFVAIATLQNVANTGNLLNEMITNGNLVVS